MEETKETKDKKLSKDTINIIRTTQRNNIDLTHIADNKANVLLSLNAIIVTFLVPLVLAHSEVILNRLLFIPLLILSSTCFTTIYIATIVLKPARFENFRAGIDEKVKFSPFFFGNFYKMEANEFYTYMQEQISNKGRIGVHLAQDLFYVGKRLGYKMTWIRRAFNIFILGIFFTLLSTLLILFIF
ncbi:DUF5706 domain-containing protein [Saprospiraceae bacterium]|jgi:hypothetical protein|nr:DUF5706 domain-containing protein [Bacteroidota bacterium]MDB4727553.1 DUF5706 domain-containing protein [Saprospiraceae bacterium]MDF1864272.1 DUF5706 domain-containing protein [Saprospiraceae bacterium]